jgi:hypothetical protein
LNGAARFPLWINQNEETNPTKILDFPEPVNCGKVAFALSPAIPKEVPRS